MTTIEQIQVTRTLDKLQRHDAVQFTGRQLRRILASMNPGAWKDQQPEQLRARAQRMVEGAEAGTLGDEDSRAMGLLGLAVLREIARGPR